MKSTQKRLRRPFPESYEMDTSDHWHGPPTLPIFLHGSLMVPEVLNIYLNQDLDGSDPPTTRGHPGSNNGRHDANEPLVVCPATLHGYHRRQYNCASKTTGCAGPAGSEQSSPQPQQPRRKKSFIILERRKTFWRGYGHNQHNMTPVLPPTPQDLHTPNRGVHTQKTQEQEKLSALLFPYILPGPTFDSKVDGILFYPRSKVEFEHFIRKVDLNAVDDVDGLVKVGARVLDVEVFVDAGRNSKEAHKCWRLIKAFDERQRRRSVLGEGMWAGDADPEKKVPAEAREWVRKSPGARSGVVIERLVWPEGYDAGEGVEDANGETMRAPWWRAGNAEGIGEQGAVIVKAVVFVAGTMPVSEVERKRELESTGLVTNAVLIAPIQGEDLDFETFEKRRKVAAYRTGLLQGGEKWRLQGFLRGALPGLVKGVEEYWEKRRVEENILRMRRWKSDEEVGQDEIYKENSEKINEENEHEGEAIRVLGRAAADGGSWPNWARYFWGSGRGMEVEVKDAEKGVVVDGKVSVSADKKGRYECNVNHVGESGGASGCGEKWGTLRGRGWMGSWRGRG
ncbi:hypothetical protein BDZ91DRAFT_765676 [Kalaharituber pfeilii]|nr:hypothetical protein BDZ91DRAFT_765676 [Kalaharituber pfeilii]